ncbi:amidohydrolase family protein [Flagellimonas sp. CMM7]|uniref:amidohydrolase family protein n=1 Tax=Flagellimonas sp. CMM7 TaxID=2654676 RepID=UPI0013D00D00|nr:amidohydrolase family protein [Flagellimonas sp. CMM7]UII79416.1 amidohydrolase family protein [Flagellimonas sp. CMM7]
MRRKVFKTLKFVLISFVVFGLIIVAGLIWPMPDVSLPEKHESILIKSINVVDVNTGNILKNRNVWIKKNRIQAIDSATSDKNYGDSFTIDGDGKYLIPGLWDMHTHSTQHSKWLHHPLYIAHGVTSIRDLSGQMGKEDSYWAGTKDRLSWNKKLENHEQVTPRYILQSSYQINGDNSVPSGFPEFFSVEDVKDVPLLLEHYQTVGADFIKVYSDIPATSYKQIAKEAPKYGLHIAGHKPLGVSLEDAITLGQRSFEHGRVFMFDCFPEADKLLVAEDKRAMYYESKKSISENFDVEKAARLMDLMHQRNAHWVPTLQMLKISAYANNQSYVENQNLKYIPTLRKKLWWNPDVGRAGKYNNSSDGKGINMKLYESAKLQVGMAHKRGVPIMTGTDVTDSYAFPGFALHTEIEEFTACGLTNLEALRAATIIPATYSNVEKDYGSVDQGKMADLVILKKNPLDNISHTASISSVLLNGVHYDKETLETYKEDTASLASSFHMNVKFFFSLLGSPLIRKQFAD